MAKTRSKKEKTPKVTFNLNGISKKKTTTLKVINLEIRGTQDRNIILKKITDDENDHEKEYKSNSSGTFDVHISMGLDYFNFIEQSPQKQVMVFIIFQYWMI